MICTLKALKVSESVKKYLMSPIAMEGLGKLTLPNWMNGIIVINFQKKLAEFFWKKGGEGGQRLFGSFS